MARLNRLPLLASLVAIASVSGCVQVPPASYAPCEGRMAARIARLPADSVTERMRDSARAESRNCAIENAMSMERQNAQLRQIQQQQVEDGLLLEQLNRQLQP